LGNSGAKHGYGISKLTEKTADTPLLLGSNAAGTLIPEK
jgi:hypothetical protein